MLFHEPINFVYYQFFKLLVNSWSFLTLLDDDDDGEKWLVGLRLAAPQAKIYSPNMVQERWEMHMQL